jgi:hypothetical protein
MAGAVGAGALILAAQGCESGSPVPAGTGSSAATARPDAAQPPRQSAVPDAGGCPATHPNPTGPRGVSSALFFGWDASHGNGTLWVGGLWPGGVITAGPEFTETDGSVSMKFGWWRAANGRLAITGRRLDAAAPPLRADVPDGYGDTGFQATGVTFPTEGCWQVTGRAGGSTLTFVTLVIKKAR